MTNPRTALLALHAIPEEGRRNDRAVGDDVAHGHERRDHECVEPPPTRRVRAHGIRTRDVMGEEGSVGTTEYTDAIIANLGRSLPGFETGKDAPCPN